MGYLLPADAESLQHERDRIIAELRAITEEIHELVTTNSASEDFEIPQELKKNEMKLNSELSRLSSIVDDCEIFELQGDEADDEIMIGSRVVLQTGDDFVEYVIAGDWHDQQNYQTYEVIRANSEFGTQLLGKKLGEEFQVEGNNGLQYLIIDIQPFIPTFAVFDDAEIGE